VIGDVIYAAAVLLLAIGLSREGSVVARKPLGLAAMVVVAVWPLTAFVLTSLLTVQEPVGGDGWMIFGYFALAVPVCAGLVAAVQIARAGVVPSPWRWAPLWVLGLQAAAWAIPNIAIVTVGSAGIQGLANILAMLGWLAFLAGTLGLGILALVIGVRQRPESVEVYRSA